MSINANVTTTTQAPQKANNVDILYGLDYSSASGNGTFNAQAVYVDAQGLVHTTGGGGGGGGNSTITGPLGVQTPAASVATTLNGQGQKTSALSTSVVLASDSAALPITGNVTVVGGGNTTVVGPLGNQTGAASVAVTLNALGNTTLLAGTGAQGAGSPRVTVAVDSATIAGSTPVVASADGVTANTVLLTANGLYNGTTEDRMYNNNNLTLIAAGFHPANVTANFTNFNGRGVMLFLNVANANGGNVTLALNGLDPVSGNPVSILTSAVVAANGTTAYQALPGLGFNAGLSANSIVPRNAQVVATVNGNVSFSVGASVNW